MDKAFLETLLAFDRRPDSARMRRRTYELLQAGPGRRVLDVGSGSGTAVAELADAGAEAVGVDAAEEAVAFAREHHPGCRFDVADAQRLPFPDGSLDGYRAEKLYHALPDPVAACAEARRVLAPGGRIVLVGQDWGFLAIDSDDPHLTTTIVNAAADDMAHGRVARRYRNLLLDTGFTEVTCEVHTAVLTDRELAVFTVTRLATGALRAGAVSDAQAGAWLTEQRARAERDRILVAFPQFVAAGTVTAS